MSDPQSEAWRHYITTLAGEYGCIAGYSAGGGGVLLALAGGFSFAVVATSFVITGLVMAYIGRRNIKEAERASLAAAGEEEEG